jgi:soluble lytic murein transglycosylase
MIDRLALLLLLAAPAAHAACGHANLPAPYDAVHAGQLAVEKGRWADARAALHGVSPPGGPAARLAHLVRGRAQLELGELTDARTSLLAALEGVGAAGHRARPCDVDPGEARWWLANGAVRRGAPDAAVTTWERIWTDNPTSPFAARAAQALTERGAAPGDPTTARGRGQIELRAATLGKQQEHKLALALLEQIPDDGSDAHRRRLAHATMKARQYQRATALFAGLAAPTPQDRFDRALATSRLGEYGPAADLYAALLREHPDAPQAAEASFKLGYLAWDGGHPETALVRCAEHRRDFPRSKHRNEALWFSGWTLMKLGRLDEARATFAELAAADSSLAAGAAYWSARIDGRQRGAAAESQALAALLERHPDTVYAWWAARALGRAWSRPPTPAMPDPAALAAPRTAALARALALSDAGLEAWAEAELSPLRAAVRGDRDAALALAQALADAGSWPASRKVAMPFCGAANQRADLVALRLCWPRPGGDAVQAAAAEAGLPPLLPFAIMHAESGFNPRVVSGAGARGLMQLMPELVDVEADALFEPATNTRLGVAELGALRASFADTGAAPLEPLIIAGYNGGEAAVRRWLNGQPSPLDVDRWAEEISYGETRRYVRRVLGTLQVYRYVYGDP